ncbi:MAG: RING finger domain-containing protein [Nitrososphaerota archaeon]|nr:E3 ubiquitin protein ligase [Candidatus Geocrenenecus dongiae]
MKRIKIGKPICRGFWNPWSVEEIKKTPVIPPKPEARQVCVICLSEIGEGASTTECPYCGAIGHKNCFDEWIVLRGKCPLCRKILTPTST